MPQSKKSKDDEIAILRQDIADLNVKVDKIQSNMKKKDKTKKMTWRKLTIGICAVVATLLLVFGNIFFWTAHTIVDTNRYVATVGPLIQKPQVQSAIALYTTNQIFNNYDVQGHIKSVLPPKAAFLAPELTSQVRSYSQKTIVALLANQKVQQYWYSSLSRRHEALISFSKNYQGNGTIEISDIYSQLSKRLSTTQLSFLANKQLPAKVGSIKVTTVGWLPTFHKLVKNLGLYQFIATSLFIITTALTIFLSSKKLRTVVKLGLVFAGFMLITLLSVKIMRGVFLSNINSTYQDAAKVVYNTILNSFVSQTIWIMIISFLVAVGAAITSKYSLHHKAKPHVIKLKRKVLAHPQTSKK